MNKALLAVPIFDNASLNEEVYNKLQQEYLNVSHDRIVRYTAALKEWMKDFPSLPLPTKESLIRKIESYEEIKTQHSSAAQKLEDLKNQLQTGQFCEGTNEHAMYRGSYEDRQLAFVWPTPEENSLRQQEEAELLAQINK